MINTKEAIPKAESVLLFARSKGWELAEKNKGFYVLTPPKGFEWPEIKLEIPFLEDEPAYPMMIIVLTNNLAQYYNWDPFALKLLLSKSPAEIEELLKQVVSLEVIKSGQADVQKLVNSI